MSNALRILFATTELAPFLKLTEKAYRNLELLSALKKQRHDIRVLMPRFGIINERRNKLHEVRRLSGINIKVGSEKRSLIIKVASIPDIRLQVYFLDNQEYFKRKSIMHDPVSEEFFEDNFERAIFFSKGILETVKKLSWSPNIIHCNGWFSALIPFYLKTKYKNDPVFANAKTVYTTDDQNLNYLFPQDIFNRIRGEGVTKKYKELYFEAGYHDFPFGAIKLSDSATQYSEVLDKKLEKRLKEAGIELPAEPAGKGNQLADFYLEIYKNLAGVTAEQ